MKNLSGEFFLSETKPPAQSKDQKTINTKNKHSHSVFPWINKESLHFYSSLCIDPKKVTVYSQTADEDIHIIVRRHHVTNIPWIALILVLTLVPIILYPFLSRIPYITFSSSTIFITVALYYLSLFGYGLLKFAEWYFHVGVITNKRLLDIDMLNILSKNVAETPMSAVVDVTYHQQGILQTFFKYGNVEIQTEAVQQNFEYDLIPHPSQVAEIINQLASSRYNRKYE